MHVWGDENVDWDGINEAALYIGTTLIRYGRVPVTDMKEKWGTVRVYLTFGWWTLYTVIRPNYMWVPKHLKWANKIPMHWLNFIIVPLQMKLYRIVYKRAIKKWPHLKEEIISDADYPELLEGL